MIKYMINYLAMLAAAALLAGCATTIRSDVTAFHEWPAQMADKSYRFDAPSKVEDTLEYRSYQNLVRAELSKLGFTEASEATGTSAANLKVAMQFSTTVHAVRVVQAIDPFWNGRSYWRGYYRNPWGYRPGAFSPFYDPFYDPFIYGPPDMIETVRNEYQRQLQVKIDTRDGKTLFDVTVRNTSGIGSTPTVMPALVASAFAGFPGRSGVPHRVDLKLE
jgi:hypothetical protein